MNIMGEIFKNAASAIIPAAMAAFISWYATTVTLQVRIEYLSKDIEKLEKIILATNETRVTRPELVAVETNLQRHIEQIERRIDRMEGMPSGGPR